jgi:hypothetical protein
LANKKDSLESGSNTFSPDQSKYIPNFREPMRVLSSIQRLFSQKKKREERERERERDVCVCVTRKA